MHNYDFFSFRTDRYDFWPIYDAIKQYYPLGIDKQHAGIYYEYPGLQQLEKIIVEHIHDTDHYKSSWTAKLESWSDELNLKLIGTTNGQTPAYSAYVELANATIHNRIITQRLHVAVSLVGPFYTIFGTDNTTLVENEEGKKRNYKCVNRTVISPFSEYTEVFRKLRKLIERDFESYRFVPYMIHSMVLKGLEVCYRDEQINRIYHALFNQYFDFQSMVAGDKYNYGSEQWLLENPNNEDSWKAL